MNVKISTGFGAIYSLSITQVPFIKDLDQMNTLDLTKLRKGIRSIRRHNLVTYTPRNVEGEHS
jgi:hypothetical protein